MVRTDVMFLTTTVNEIEVANCRNNVFMLQVVYVGFFLLLSYFSIDNAHLIYNAHPKLFRHSFCCIDNAHDVLLER